MATFLAYTLLALASGHRMDECYNVIARDIEKTSTSRCMLQADDVQFNVPGITKENFDQFGIGISATDCPVECDRDKLFDDLKNLPQKLKFQDSRLYRVLQAVLPPIKAGTKPKPISKCKCMSSDPGGSLDQIKITEFTGPTTSCHRHGCWEEFVGLILNEPRQNFKAQCVEAPEPTRQCQLQQNGRIPWGLSFATFTNLEIGPQVANCADCVKDKLFADKDKFLQSLKFEDSRMFTFLEPKENGTKCECMSNDNGSSPDQIKLFELQAGNCDRNSCWKQMVKMIGEHLNELEVECADDESAFDYYDGSN